MAAPIGFALSTYRDPPQIVRLIARLRRLYGPEAPIVLHHDFGQAPLDQALLPPGVRVVRPHLTTSWGAWATVDSVLHALRLLHADGEGPEYTVLLSGTDYPVATPERVLADYRGAGADAYLPATPVTPWQRDRGAAAGPLGFGINEGPSNQKVCYRRYYPTTLRPLGIRLRVRSPLLAPLLAPFSREFRCYAGEHWWTLGRRAVLHLLAFHEARPDLARWFAEREIPEEAYVHTVVWNAPELRKDRRNFRFIDWSSRAPSPRTLTVDDLPRIVESGCHFARKFAAGDPALDRLDTMLGLDPWNPASP